MKTTSRTSPRTFTAKPPRIPAVRAGITISTATPSNFNLGCISIAPSGTGIFSNISDRGVAQINWGDSLERSFGASFLITPWP